MEVGLITPGFSASEADWCIPAQLDLVRALARDHDVRVFALRYPHERRTYRVYGAEVHAFGAAQRGGLHRPLAWARAIVRLLREHRRRPFDVLHALWAHEPGFVAAVAGRLTGTPVVVSVLGGELVDLPGIDYGGGRGVLNRRLIPIALRAAARVTVGSSFLKAIAEEAGRWDERWRLWPLGVDSERFRPGPPSPPLVLDGRPALLHVGSLVPVKDQATLLRAFVAALPRLPEARLHFVGDGPEHGRLAALAADQGILDAVRFHGALPHEGLADLYRQADVFVLSSRFESQAMAVLEAAASGCRVVGPAVGVVPDVTSAGVAPGDAPALAAAIVRAAGEPRPTEDAGAALRARFGLEAAVARLRGLYEECTLGARPVSASSGSPRSGR
jgi:glycosyltransferase involved in cell wall biosynthesis